MTRRLPAALALLALGAPACIHPIEEDASAIGEVIRDCVVPVPSGVAGLGAPIALEYPDGSLWIWAELTLAGGGTVANAAARVGDAAAVCADGPALQVDAAGAPVSLLALTAAEVADNATRTDGRRLALVPTGGFVDGGTGHLFYDHVLYGPGLLDEEVLGTGLCVLATGAATCERVDAGAGTILWTPAARTLNRGGVVDGDRAVLYGCRRVASFSDPCTVAGVPLARVRDPAAYQVWNVFDGWVDRAIDASVFADLPGPITVSAFDDGFLATELDIFTSRFSVRRADNPRDGFGPATAIVTGVAPASWFVQGGREHAGLRDDPTAIHLSYATDGAAAPGLHLVTFRFFGRFE